MDKEGLVHSPKDESVSRFCLSGPDPAGDAVGGVVTHMRVLSRLAFFSGSPIVDIGTRAGAARLRWTSMLRRLYVLRRTALRKQGVLINVSLYRGSMLKLCAQLSVLRRRRKRQVVVCFHGGRVEDLKGLDRLVLYLLRLYIKRVDRCLFLTEAQREGFQREFGQVATGLYRNFSEHNEVIEHIEDPRGICRLLFVGRVTQTKGVFEVVEAFRRLHFARPGRFRLVIVGDGDGLEGVRKSLGDVDGEWWVCRGQLTGSALESEYACADLLVLPSMREAFPYVFVEAMRAGVPMVGTPVGAIPRLIRPGMNGYLVSTNNVPEIVGTILRHFGNSARHADMRAYCHGMFRCSLNAQAGDEFYRRLLGDA